MKKLVYFVLCISLFLLVPSRVFAQTSSNLPEAPRALIYDNYNFVQEHERTYEYEVIYYLPFRLDRISGSINYVFVYKWQHAFSRATYNLVDSSYILDEYILTDEGTEFYFVFTVNKHFVNTVYNGDIERIFINDSAMYIDFKYSYLREYFYRIPPSKRPENLYEVGMPYDSGSAYAGRLYWTLAHYIDISDYIENYNLFLSYTTVEGAYLQSLYFYDEDYNEVAYVQFTDYLEEYIYKFENENRYVVGMVHFRDIDGDFINWDNVKYMRFTYHTEPYPDSQVLIKLTNTLDISIGEYWRVAEAFNAYYQAGYEEGFNIGYGRGQEIINDEILEMLEKEYQRGYNAGMNDNFNVFSYLEALFGEQGLGRLLKIELLPGVSLGAVIMIPLAFWLVSFIMRWFR